jgi:hypothetical protein
MLGYFEAKYTENIWLRYLTPYKLDIKSPLVKDIEMINEENPTGIPIIRTFFIFTTDLIDSYEKYPESVVSGLTKIGGMLALFRIVSLALFYLHRYLFETHIKKKLSLKEEGEDD